MGLTLFEEDDFIFTLSCASGYWIVLLPYMDKLDFYHIDQRPPASRQRMMRFYGECVRRQPLLERSRQNSSEQESHLLRPSGHDH